MPISLESSAVRRCRSGWSGGCRRPQADERTDSDHCELRLCSGVEWRDREGVAGWISMSRYTDAVRAHATVAVGVSGSAFVFVSLVRRDHTHSRAARIKYIWIGIVTITGNDQSAIWTRHGDEAVEKKKKRGKKSMLACGVRLSETRRKPTRLHATSTKRHAPTRHWPG